jgi:hypothetical protein
MKRKTVSKSPSTSTRARTIAAHRLTAVRGGIGIAVAVVTPPQWIMQNQHNETLIRL